MTFILLKTIDNLDFITNTSNILTIDTRDAYVDLHVQKPAKSLSAWNENGLQSVFSIAVEKGTEKARAIGLAQEINNAEQSGTMLDLRGRHAPKTGSPTPLSGSIASPSGK